MILFLDVLEHCRWPADVLKRVQEVLNPGGFIIASIPNVANWSVRINLLMGRFEYEQLGLPDETHLRFFTVKSACRLFETAGYRIDFLDHRFSIPIFRMRRFLGGLLAKFLGRMIPGLFS